jgi:streptomycin 6-kinase
VGAPTAACDPRRDTWGVGTISIPPQLADALTDDDDPARVKWLEALPKAVAQIASDWELELGEPFLPGGVCAWVARARNAAGDELVLKVGWRHHEAEHEADGLRHWDGDGAVRCFAARSHGDTSALLLERCMPGGQLGHVAPEHRQDEIIAGLLRRLWMRVPGNGHPFRPLSEMCDQWADGFEDQFATDRRGLDPGLARHGVELLRDLPRTAGRAALLCTDLHAGNVLAAKRESWLVIDPKPFVGDPAYDTVQHMLNCDDRLASDPAGLAGRMAALLDLDCDRVRLWLLARCVQESLLDVTLREPARRLGQVCG